MGASKRLCEMIVQIFGLDMGSSVKIDTLARNLIKFSGFKPDVDIKIGITKISLILQGAQVGLGLSWICSHEERWNN